MARAGSDQSTDLPKGWRERVDQNSGNTYYYNQSTGDRTWSKPPSLSQLPPGWEVRYDKERRRWYYGNRELRISQWEPPTDSGQDQSNKTQVDKQLNQMFGKDFLAGVVAVVQPTEGNSEIDDKNTLQTQVALQSEAQTVQSNSKSQSHSTPQAPKSRDPGIILKELPLSLKSEIHKFNQTNFAQEHFRKHVKGFFGRIKVPTEEMMQMQLNSMKEPLLISTPKAFEKPSLANFDDILTYQGLKRGKIGRITIETKDKQSEGEKKKEKQMTSVAHQIAERGRLQESLRNEIYCQLIKQTTVGNEAEKELQPNALAETIRRGWQLIMICCETFAPQQNFESVLLSHIDKAMDAGQISPDGTTASLKEEISMFATYSLNKLLTTVRFGGILKVDEKKISDIQKVTKVRRVFDCSLADIMLRQSILPAPEKDFLVPTVLLFLTNKLIQTGGLKTEGIFRKCVTIDETENAIALLNLGDYNNPFFTQTQTNPHSYAVLLKNWLKRLEEPIVPYALYEDALNTVRPPSSDDAGRPHVSASEFLLTQLPLANVLTFKSLARFLKKVYAEENVKQNLMAVQNVALIFAPTLIKSKSDDPTIMATNLRLEISFVMTVILETGILPLEEESRIAEAEKWVYDNYCKQN